MASFTSKEGTKETFKWSDEDTYILCEVCRDFIKNNGKTTFFRWKEIQMEVEKKIGRVFHNSSSCKHKYDAMRKDWIKWKALKQPETGLGWDPISGKIDAENEWWDRKIKENPDFKKFRQRGINSILEEHWEILFGDSCATGENVYVPTMEPIEDLTVEDENNEEECVGVERRYQSNQFKKALLDEENFLENFLEEAKNSGKSNMPGSSQVVIEGGNKRVSKVQKQTTTHDKDVNTQIKRTKRQSAGSAMLSKGISEMAECVKRMSQSSSTNVSTISGAMKIISHMVDNFLLQKHSDLWCFANTIIEDANKREIFLNMEDDESRLTWLQFLYAKMSN